MPKERCIPLPQTMHETSIKAIDSVIRVVLERPPGFSVDVEGLLLSIKIIIDNYHDYYKQRPNLVETLRDNVVDPLRNA